MEDGIESFWGVELTSEKSEEVWSFKVEENDETDSKDEEPDHDYMSHELFVKMATLGKGTEKGEEHVVQVETADKDGKMLKIPIINMVAGVNNTVCVNADFTDKHTVTFRLIEGSGPIYLSGTCLQEYPRENVDDSQDESMFTGAETTATDEDEDDDESEDESDEESDEEMEMEKGKKGKAGVKRKPTAAASKASKAKQRSKLESKEDSEEDSEEDDEDLEDEEEDASSKKKKGKPGVSPRGVGKSPKGKPEKKGPAAVQADKKKKQKAKAK